MTFQGRDMDFRIKSFYHNYTVIKWNLIKNEQFISKVYIFTMHYAMLYKILSYCKFNLLSIGVMILLIVWVIHKNLNNFASNHLNDSI